MFVITCEEERLIYFGENYKDTSPGAILHLIKWTTCLLAVQLSFMRRKLRRFCKYFIVSDPYGHCQFTLRKIQVSKNRGRGHGVHLAVSVIHLSNRLQKLHKTLGW